MERPVLIKFESCFFWVVLHPSFELSGKLFPYPFWPSASTPWKCPSCGVKLLIKYFLLFFRQRLQESVHVKVVKLRGEKALINHNEDGEEQEYLNPDFSNYQLMPRVLFFSRCSYANGLCSVTVGVAGSFCSTHVR